MTEQQIRLLVGGLGMFLFGSLAFEEAIWLMVTKNFKRIFKKATNNLFSAIAIGFSATVALQSSAVVSLIAVSFVGAGIIGLGNAIGIILGTNIGSPVMDIILTNIWFKFSLSSIALPIIWIGGLVFMIFWSFTRVKNISRSLVAFWFVILGLGFMKESMEVIASSVNLAEYASLNGILYFLMGFVVTLLMQSSSATTILVLTAASTGIISYHMGIPLIMWAFLGTTLTVVLASISRNVLKRQVAFSHVFFNLFSVILWMLFLPLLVRLFEFSFEKNYVLGLSVFAMSFKIVWVIILFPFIGYFTRFLRWMFPFKETPLGLNIEQVDPAVYDAAIIAMKKDTIKLFKKIFACVLHIWSVDDKRVLTLSSSDALSLDQEKNFEDIDIRQEYETIKIIEEKLFAYWSQIKKFSPRNNGNGASVDSLYTAISSAVMAVKYMKDVSVNISFLKTTSSKWCYKQYEEFRITLVSLYKIISEVIDEKHSDDVLPKMLSLVADIKQADQAFLKNLTQKIDKDSIKKFDLSDVLHVNRYVYLSSMSFVDAVKHMYMESAEKKAFEQLK
jgi:phosphate:Na+ symporter